jgi:putative NADPH-quinone reductase
MVGDTAKPSLHTIRKLAVVTTYGGSRLNAFLLGDPPRKLVKRLLRLTVKPGAPVSYLAHYSMNASTEASRKRFMRKVMARMDAF